MVIYLFAFLKLLITVAAHETIDMIHIIILNSHHQLIGIDFLTTPIAFGAVYSILNKKWKSIIIN